MQICTLIVLQYNKKKNKEHIHIFIANDITKKLTLVTDIQKQRCRVSFEVITSTEY